MPRFFAVMVHTRQTLREIQRYDSTAWTAVLISLSGAARALDVDAFDGKLPPYLAVSLALVMMPLIYLIVWPLVAWFLSVAGRLLGGKANSSDLRCVLAWSAAPYVLYLVGRLQSIVMFGQPGLSNGFVHLDFQSLELIRTTEQVVFLVAALVELRMRIIGISEAHGFGLLRAIATSFLAVLIPIAIGVASYALYQALSG